MASEWTGPEALVRQVERRWQRGELLRGEVEFPLRLSLRRPGPRELGARFEEVRRWIQALREGERRGYRLELEQVANRQLGHNAVPKVAWVDSRDEALRLIGKGAAAREYERLRAQVEAALPALGAWMRERPLKALELADEWPKLLGVARWFLDHPRSGLYLRQIELPGVDTKFIERHRALLTELLERVDGERFGPPDATFETRFGLKEKPFLVRMRFLEPGVGLNGLADLAVPVHELAKLQLPVDEVLVIENGISGLAVPERARTLAIFGHGYAVERLREVEWLGQKRLLYWGDIDTHGLAMLSRFRRHFPRLESVLMDRATLLQHRAMWVEEKEPTTEVCEHLTAAEAELMRDLLRGTWGERVRLEQERLSFASVRRALA